MFDLTTYVKKWRIRQLKTVFSTLDTLWRVGDNYLVCISVEGPPVRFRYFGKLGMGTWVSDDLLVAATWGSPACGRPLHQQVAAQAWLPRSAGAKIHKK